MWTDIDKSWAAGFFEGEGSVRINKATCKNLGALIVCIVNTDPSCIEFFQKEYPGYYKITQCKGNRKIAYRWIISSLKAMNFLETIRPFIKREVVLNKIDLGIEFQKQKVSRHLISDEYRSTQFSYYLQMQLLNRRGNANNYR